MGVLSALPIIAAGNLCCCLWVVSGGAIAAYLLQQSQATPIEPGDGALVGLLGIHRDDVLGQVHQPLEAPGRAHR